MDVQDVFRAFLTGRKEGKEIARHPRGSRIIYTRLPVPSASCFSRFYLANDMHPVSPSSSFSIKSDSRIVKAICMAKFTGSASGMIQPTSRKEVYF